MAKKRKKKSGTSRRRVGAAKLNPKSNMVRGAAVVAGYFLGDKINAAIDKPIGTKLDTKIIAGGQIGLGSLLMLKGKASLPKTIVGGVLAGAGLKRAMSAFGIGAVGGYGKVPVIGNRRVAGYGKVPVIGNSGVGAYTTNGQVGAYVTKGMAKVMGSASGSGSGSGLMQ